MHLTQFKAELLTIPDSFDYAKFQHNQKQH